VAGGAGQTAEYPAKAGGSLSDFAVPFTVGADPVLPLSLTIGKWLLAGAGPGSQKATWQAIASGTPAADCLSLGEKLAALAPRCRAARHGRRPRLPGPRRPGSHAPRTPNRYDSQGDGRPGRRRPGALAALDPGRDQELFVAGRAAWQVLAGAVIRGGLHRGPSLRLRPLRGELLRRHLDAGTHGHTRGMGTRVIAVVGATATGKSGLATELALALGGEVVNADSMQLYQGMDIGTAKEPRPPGARPASPARHLDR